MDKEINAGYVITDRLAVGVGSSEFVIGERAEPVGVADFVTWTCRKGERDYVLGHYCNDRLAAVENFCKRVQEEVQYQRTFHPELTPAEQRPQKTAHSKDDLER